MHSNNYEKIIQHDSGTTEQKVPDIRAKELHWPEQIAAVGVHFQVEWSVSWIPDN